MLTSGSSNHNQNRYQAVVSTWAHVSWKQGSLFFKFYFTVAPAGASKLFHFICCFSTVLPSWCYHRLPFCHRAWCCTIILQPSSKPFPSSSFSSLSRHLQPLKVVNRKRPPRDEWNNYSSQGDHEGDRPSQDMNQDICIKVRDINGGIILKTTDWLAWKSLPLQVLSQLHQEQLWHLDAPLLKGHWTNVFLHLQLKPNIYKTNFKKTHDILPTLVVGR